MASDEQKRAWLAEAENAYHRLQTGTGKVMVTYNGRSVTYAQSDRASLKSYIQELKIELGDVPARSRAIRPRF